MQKVSHVPQAKALCAAGSQTWVQKLKGCGSCRCKAAWCTRKPGLPQQQLCATPPLYAGGVLKACLGTAVNIMHLFYQRGFIAPSPASSSCLFMDIYLFGVFFLILLYSRLALQLVGAEFWLSVCRWVRIWPLCNVLGVKTACGSSLLGQELCWWLASYSTNAHVYDREDA